MTNAEHDQSSDVFNVVHKKERQIHVKHSEFHHGLKTHHFRIMAMINMLYK